MDKATPESAPASVDSFMSLLRNHENRISETYGVLQDRRIPSEEVRAAIDASWEARNALIAEVERLAAQAARTEAPQEFESAQGRALASAWAEGWTQCRDAEYAGEEAQSEAFNQSYTLAQCLHADQTRLQGGLSNDQLRRAWGAKLPRVIPTDEQLTAFALGIEVAVAQSAPLAQQAAEPTYTDDLELRYAEVCEERDHLRAVLSDRAAAQVEPVRMLTKEALTDLIAQHLSGTYHCLRVWEAWHVGTMSADDFQDVGESDTPAELADAIIAAGKRIPADGEVRG